LGQLQSGLAKFRSTGAEIVGISPDDVAVLKKFSDAAAIEFPLLADESSKTIHAYGIHNTGGLPHPGTFIIGQDGKVKAKIFIDGYKERHSNEALLTALRDIEHPR